MALNIQNRTRWKFLAAFSAIIFLSLFSLPPDSAAAPKELLIGTSRAGGDLFPTGVGIGKVITEKAGIKATAQPTGGAVANVKLLTAGKIDLGIVNTAGLGLAVNRKGPFKKKKQDVVAMFVMFDQYMYWFGRDNAGVKSWKDVAGKRIWMGGPGGMAFRIGNQVIKTMGIKVKPMLSKTRLGAQAMRDGRLEAMTGFSLGANRTPFVEQLTSVYKMNFFGPPKKARDAIVKNMTGVVHLTFPPGIYDKQDKPVKTVGFYSLLVTNSRLSDSDGYKIAKALHQNQDAIKKISATGRSINIRAGKSLVPKGVKWNAGAVRYLKEAGVWKN